MLSCGYGRHEYMEKRNEMTIYEKQSRERINYLIATFCDGSQQRFSEKTKLNKASVSQYVNGKNLPGNITSAKIAQVFNVNPAWVMGFDVPMEPPAAPESSSDAPVQLRSDESELLSKYNRLNDDGKREVKNHTDYILSQNRFLKDTSEVIREVG